MSKGNLGGILGEDGNPTGLAQINGEQIVCAAVQRVANLRPSELTPVVNQGECGGVARCGRSGKGRHQRRISTGTPAIISA